MRCIQKLIFFKDRVLNFSVWLCRGYAQEFWGFSLNRLLDGKSLLSNVSTVDENYTFGVGVTKNI